MKRINYKELTIDRILNFFGRKLIQFPSFILWKYNKYLNSQTYSSISQLQNKHYGERVFILANGPSLKNIDFSLLKGNFSSQESPTELKNQHQEYKHTFLYNYH